jgi:hypothetical protein
LVKNAASPSCDASGPGGMAADCDTSVDGCTLIGLRNGDEVTVRLAAQ